MLQSMSMSMLKFWTSAVIHPLIYFVYSMSGNEPVSSKIYSVNSRHSKNRFSVLYHPCVSFLYACHTYTWVDLLMFTSTHTAQYNLLYYMYSNTLHLYLCSCERSDMFSIFSCNSLGDMTSSVGTTPPFIYMCVIWWLPTSAAISVSFFMYLNSGKSGIFSTSGSPLCLYQTLGTTTR